MLENDRALLGLRVLVTRTREQAGLLSQRLRELGAQPVEYPTIEIVPPRDWSPLDAALRRLSTYDWIIFTSVNGGRFFFERLDALGLERRFPPRLRWGAIGPATARALAQEGQRADFVPTRFVAEAIVEEIGEVSGQRILLPRAEGARAVLALGLRGKRAYVDEVTVYRTLPVRDYSRLAEALRSGHIDVVTFTSSSTVHSLVDGLGPQASRLLSRTWVACIGPITARTARELGLRVDGVASSHTTEGLVEALLSSATLGRDPA
ncbi:MAG: uroporphyrinogen-III synthase [Chloroflexi bacterium]|nr:uroporphyrinogen-III synthase [Chloroflexota bacterium]